MLLGIDPLLSGELLHVLDDMGHSDRLLLADANFPLIRYSCPVIRVGDVPMSRVLDAVLSVFPLNEPRDEAVTRMRDEADPASLNAAQRACLEVMRRIDPQIRYRVPPLVDFYAEVKTVAAIVHMIEPTPRSCLILKKGIIIPA
ncbi:MAG: RbsD/FucU domain-containing protein [Protaetiibacter sp.]